MVDGNVMSNASLVSLQACFILTFLTTSPILQAVALQKGPNKLFTIIPIILTMLFSYVQGFQLFLFRTIIIPLSNDKNYLSIQNNNIWREWTFYIIPNWIFFSFFFITQKSLCRINTTWLPFITNHTFQIPLHPNSSFGGFWQVKY